MYCKKTASFSGEIFKENFTDIFYTNLEQIAFSIAFPIKNSVKRKAEKKPKAKISLHIKIGDYLSSGDKIGEKESNICKHHYRSVDSYLPSPYKRFQNQIKDIGTPVPKKLTRVLTEGHRLLANSKFARRFDRLATCPQLQFPSVYKYVDLAKLRFAWPSSSICKKMLAKGLYLQFVKKKTNVLAYKSSCKTKLCVPGGGCTCKSCASVPEVGKKKQKGDHRHHPLANQSKQSLTCKSKICTYQRYQGLAPVIYKLLIAQNKYKDNLKRFALTRKKINPCYTSPITFAEVKRSFVKRYVTRFVPVSPKVYKSSISKPSPSYKYKCVCLARRAWQSASLCKEICKNTSKPMQEDLYGMFKGQKNNRTPLMLTSSGRVVMISKNQLILQKTQPVLFYDSAKLHVKKGEFVLQGAPLLTLTHQTLITGDIVQGIPRIEQLFEAFTSPQKGLKDKKRLNVHDTLHSQVRDIFRKNWLKNVLSVAVRKSLEEIGSILLELIQKVYLSQGVLISDKHIEIIIRQMTSKGQILDSGSTGLLLEEVLPIRQIENANITTPGKKCLYVPSVVGLTAAALTCDSFISAASFQETTRVLSRDAVVGKTDFLRGLKEKVVIGDLISAGTGLDIYFVYTLFSESISYVQQSKTVNK